MKNIVLLGFMGTGKTTIGTLLSKQCNMPLVDMDSIIEKRAGKKISDIFAEDGEPHFRTLERALIQELSEKEDQIISTGGGIVINPDNITDLNKKGLVVCLLATAAEVLERVQHDNTRPLLAGDKKEKIIELLATRQPLYDAIEHKINTTQQTPEAIASKILKLYRA